MSEAEAGLIERVLDRAPSRRVLDLGCGDGATARRLGERGFAVVAIDASEKALELARAEPVPPGVSFVLGDMGAVERLVTGHFGAAICLGNSLPHLLTPESLSRMLVGLRRRLLPGAAVLLQVLDYDRIFARGKLALPTELIAGHGGHRLVVRVAEPRADGIVVHTTSTLAHGLDRDPMIEVLATRATQLRGWRRAELVTLLEVARFGDIEVYGDLAGGPHAPGSSAELVLVAS